MKNIFILMVIFFLLPFSVGWASGVVNNSTSSQTAHDSLSIPFRLLDSTGNYVALASGDSVFLHVWYPGGALAFEDSGAYNDGDITTETRHGRTWYNWQAQVSNLDGTPTEGVYSYEFSVHDKTSANLWTDHSGDFQLYATSDFDVTLDGIDANQTDLNTIITDVTGINGWSPIFDNDSLIIDQSSLEDMTVATVTDVTNGVTLANDAITAAKIAADAIGSSELAGTAADEIRDSVITDSTVYQGSGGSAATIAAAVHNYTHGGAGNFANYGDSTTNKPAGYWLKIAGDSSLWANLSDAWRNRDTLDVDSSDLGVWLVNNLSGASQALIDSVNAILDTLQLWDTRIDSLEAALSDASIGDKTWVDPGTRTITGDTYTPDVNVSQISGDAGAADTLEALLDGTGTTLWLRQFHCVAIDGNKSAFVATGHGTGEGFHATGGAGGHGIQGTGGSNGGDGIFGIGGTSGNYGGSGIKGEGGTGAITGGEGFYGVGGDDNGVGFVLEGGNVGGHGFTSTGSGTGHGMKLLGGATGYGLDARAGATSGHGILAYGRGNGFSAIYGFGDNGNVHGFTLNANGTGNDLRLLGDGRIVGYIDSIGAGGIDAAWNEDSTGHYTPPHMAYLASQTGAGNSITDADMAAIADTLYNRDSSMVDTSAYGRWAKDSIGGGGGGATAAEIADTAKNRYFGDTTFAYILNAPDYLSIPNDTASCTKDTSVGVHPTVVFIADSIGVPAGDSLSEAPQYTFVMGYTPFGGGSACGTYKENPCIVGSNNGDDWEIPYYIDTSGGGNDTVIASTPLVDTSYFHCWHMSDIQLLYAQDTLYCYYRVNWGTVGVGDSTAIYCQTTVDLVKWSDTIRVKKVGAGKVRIMSQVLIEESGGSFSLIYLDDSTSSGTDPQLVKLNSTEPAVAFDTLTTIDTLIYAPSEPGRIPWHLDIERSGTFYHAFVTERISGGADYSNHFAISANGTTYVAKYEPILKVGDPGQWDDNILYKMCGIPNNNNIEPFYDVYYSAQSATGDGEYHIGRSRLRFSPRPNANLYAISGDMKAANDFENLLDGGRHVTLFGDIDGYVLPGRFNNLLTNGDFETDSVVSTPPSGWTFLDSTDALIWVQCRSYNDNFAIDTWRYKMKNYLTDTLRLTQRLYLDRGIYVLSGYLKVDTALNKMGLAISNQDSLPNAGFTDSIFVSGEDIFKRYTLQFTVSDADTYSVGVVFQGLDANQTGWVDDIKLQRVKYDSDPFGSGGALVTLYAYDSANSTTVSGVTFAIRTLAGTDWAKITTGSSGADTYNARVNDTLVITGFRVGYVWPVDTIVITSTSHTDTTQGYAKALGSPSSADLCRVYADFSLQGGEMTEGVTLVATKIGVNLEDTCQSAWFTEYIYKSAPSDSNGRAFVDVIKSKCLNEEDGGANSPWYIFEAFLDGQSIMRPIRDSVPDVDSMRVY